MKKIFLFAAFFAAVFTQRAIAQDTINEDLSTLLNSYYQIKNDLISSNSVNAATHAGVFLNMTNSVDMKTLSAIHMKSLMSLKDKLSFDARYISASLDINNQREHFADFSANFFKLAKGIKLTDQAVYYDYCPMKKSYWLSADVAIKNPYYGSQMLTCGKVTETLNK